MREPLVDTVELKAVVTDPYRILDLNLNTCTVSDLTFLTDFKLRATRDDFVHAIVAWFDIGFEACHKPVRFSTGPHAKYTHWKQTVFYLQDPLVISVRPRFLSTLWVFGTLINGSAMRLSMGNLHVDRIVRINETWILRLIILSKEASNHWNPSIPNIKCKFPPHSALQCPPAVYSELTAKGIGIEPSVA